MEPVGGEGVLQREQEHENAAAQTSGTHQSLGASWQSRHCGGGRSGQTVAGYKGGAWGVSGSAVCMRLYFACAKLFACVQAAPAPARHACSP